MADVCSLCFWFVGLLINLRILFHVLQSFVYKMLLSHSWVYIRDEDKIKPAGVTRTIVETLALIVSTFILLLLVIL